MAVTSNGQRIDGCAISDVSANEGNAARDIAITGDLSLELRATRLGTGQGRIYTVEVGCLSGGTTSSGITEVLVPHDQRR
ncbi:MAG: hypothetical protein RQ847_08760 [Wenzhouxiangellaceae bacterium]|nr:hypothetical protein [Wenzhouxiangellaceae bacterium]